jgi:methyltransferase (TIGR00027 family)
MPFRAFLWPLFRRRFLQEYERRGPGVYFHHQARTKRFDALWLEELAAGARQFVLLGAGFDTRAVRFAERLRGARVFEIDHPLTGAEKQRRLRRIVEGAQEHVTYVPIDFVRESLADRLASSGFDAARRTLFLWEGVTPYLTADAVDATLALVARAAEGSSIAFDYIYRSALDHPSDAAKKQLDLARSKGEPYEFGVDPADLAPLLERHGLTLDSNLGSDDLVQRYLVGSDGNVWGRPPPFMGIAHARVN